MEMILFRKGVEHVVLYDDDDHDLISKYHWNITNYGYVVAYLKGVSKRSQKKISMHRLIMGLLEDSKILVDHANCIRTDNRRCNLRQCNHQQNMANSRSRGKSKYKGVSIVKKGNKVSFVASISKSGKRYLLGIFDEESDAAFAYDNKARELFGEFALVNFPDQTRTPVARKKMTSSGFRGVYITSLGGRTYIYAAIRGSNLGSFKSKEDAARAYNEAAIKRFGDKAVLNDVSNLV